MIGWDLWFIWGNWMLLKHEEKHKRKRCHWTEKRNKKRCAAIERYSYIAFHSSYIFNKRVKLARLHVWHDLIENNKKMIYRYFMLRMCCATAFQNQWKTIKEKIRFPYHVMYNVHVCINRYSCWSEFITLTARARIQFD